MKNKNLVEEGQISLFDLEITPNPIKVTKTEEKVTEIINKVTLKENEKVEKPLELTEKQKDFLSKNNIMENENLSRIILHAKNGITIEIKESGTFISHYINSEGQKQFDYPSKSSVLPWDKIIYSEIKEVPLTEIQETKVQKLINELKDIRRIVKRKGDENIILELEEGVLSINSLGWELPFESIDHVDCEENEIYLIPDREVKKELTKNVGIVAKVGDYVQADNKEIIEGKLISNYNSGCTFSIIYDNGTKHTAIPRVAILKILKSA